LVKNGPVLFLGRKMGKAELSETFFYKNKLSREIPE